MQTDGARIAQFPEHAIKGPQLLNLCTPPSLCRAFQVSSALSGTTRQISRCWKTALKIASG